MELYIYIQAVTLVSKTQIEDYVAVWLPYASKLFILLHAGRDFQWNLQRISPTFSPDISNSCVLGEWWYPALHHLFNLLVSRESIALITELVECAKPFNSKIPVANSATTRNKKVFLTLLWVSCDLKLISITWQYLLSGDQFSFCDFITIFACFATFFKPLDLSLFCTNLQTNSVWQGELLNTYIQQTQEELRTVSSSCIFLLAVELFISTRLNCSEGSQSGGAELWDLYLYSQLLFLSCRMEMYVFQFFTHL